VTALWQFAEISIESLGFWQIIWRSMHPEFGCDFSHAIFFLFEVVESIPEGWELSRPILGAVDIGSLVVKLREMHESICEEFAQTTIAVLSLMKRWISHMMRIPDELEPINVIGFVEEICTNGSLELKVELFELIANIFAIGRTDFIVGLMTSAFGDAMVDAENWQVDSLAVSLCNTVENYLNVFGQDADSDFISCVISCLSERLGMDDDHKEKVEALLTLCSSWGDLKKQ
jgi:hypothetical protein